MRQCKNRRSLGVSRKSTYWTTADAMAIMTGRPAEEENKGENKGEFRVCIPSGSPEDVEPPPQSVVVLERSQHKWRGTRP